MSRRNLRLIDASDAVLATAQVADEGDHYGGTIDLRATPTGLRALFDEFEEIVNGQMFVFLEDIQERIGALPIKGVFDDGFEVLVKDLQVFPSTGDFSFKVVESSARSTDLA
jgi:hypothetical protein